MKISPPQASPAAGFYIVKGKINVFTIDTVREKIYNYRKGGSNRFSL